MRQVAIVVLLQNFSSVSLWAEREFDEFWVMAQRLFFPFIPAFRNMLSNNRQLDLYVLFLI